MRDTERVREIKPKSWADSIKDFYNNHKSGIQAYGILPALALASFPLAGIYLARKQAGGYLLNTIAGVALSTILAIGSLSLKMAAQSNQEIIGNIKGSHTYSYEIKDEDRISTLELITGTALMLGTNFPSLRMLLGDLPKGEGMTTVTVNANDGEDCIKCNYKIKGLKQPPELKGRNLGEPTSLSINRVKINGALGRKLYGG